MVDGQFFVVHLILKVGSSGEDVSVCVSETSVNSYTQKRPDTSFLIDQVPTTVLNVVFEALGFRIRRPCYRLC